MCMMDKMSPEDKGMEHKEMWHMGMRHHMKWGGQSDFPLIGDKFPQMDVKTTQGMIKLPDDFSGKWFVLFSHPADFTPVCTTEFVAFENKRLEFEKLNCQLIGLSIDQVSAHMKWTEWIKEKLGVEIKFPLIADDLGKVASRMGMIHPGKGTNTVRAVFIIDPNGVVRLILFYPQEVGRNMEEILRVVKALQVSDANKVSMPANWPNNNLIKDEVIIPPPQDEKTAKTRVTGGEIVCYDWWFCHKKL
jgi:peroxiredoxin (alkyl hydroperoxide reductase subunit C)